MNDEDLVLSLLAADSAGRILAKQAGIGSTAATIGLGALGLGSTIANKVVPVFQKTVLDEQPKTAGIATVAVEKLAPIGKELAGMAGSWLKTVGNVAKSTVGATAKNPMGTFGHTVRNLGLGAAAVGAASGVGKLTGTVGNVLTRHPTSAPVSLGGGPAAGASEYGYVVRPPSVGG